MAQETAAQRASHPSPTADDHPSIHPSAFLAPSDFLPGLPASTDVRPADDDDEAADDDTPPKASSAAPTRTDAQGRTLNPRSCVTCRRRKVRCDKLHPCSNCNRAHIECVFPAPGRAPRKTRKVGDTGRDKELLERLRRLEGVVKGLGVEVPDSKGSQNDGENITSGARKSSTPAEGSRQEECSTSNGKTAEQDFRAKTNWVEEQSKGRFENRFGRLVVNEGKSRYINNSFWANLSNEVEDLKGILNQSSDEEDNMTASPGSSANVPDNHQGFVFGFSSQSVDLLNLHPLPGQICEYWEIFKDRVDPLCKVLHIPSLEPTILSSASHLAHLSRGFECLLFAVYYGATTSLSTHDCLLKLGEEKTVLLARYRFAVEQALARANLLTTEEMVVLQAFVVFLICLRRNNDARVIWTLTGLVVRIAQTIGIHRDGSHFGLAPFEVEMRRRLWWQVCILDTRASEDHGCDPTIVEQSFDTKMPLNINDDDIWPGIKNIPAERQGCTMMSFCLLRFEVANTFRRLNYIPPGPPKACGDFFASVTLEDKERWITECHQRIEERYLKHCDMSVPLYWVTATVARLMMSKMWLMVYHPFQRQNGGASLSDEVKEKLFITSLENMEYSLLLETESRTMKWGWLFKTYVQWHALAFTLSELSHRTTGPLVERAWAAVEKTRDGRWGAQFSEETNSGHLWRPLKKLYKKAKEARQCGLQEEVLTKQTELSSPPIRTYSPNENPMFGNSRRPHVTRAPLSWAQLQRFTEGPTFGQAPLDKHELLRSPPLPEKSVDPLVLAGSGTTVLGTPPLQVAQPDLMDDMKFSMPAGNSVQEMPDPIAARADIRPRGNFGQNFFSATANIDFGDFELDNGEQQRNGNGNETSGEHVRMDSIDSMDNDLSVMDTSGDLNWENWDQLVRQFGTDVDSGQVPAGGTMAAWNGPNWEMGTNSQNLRMGMGMGGGDWF